MKEDLCPFVDWVLVHVIFTKQNSIDQAYCIARWSKTTSDSTLDLQITKNKCNKVSIMISDLAVKIKGVVEKAFNYSMDYNHFSPLGFLFSNPQTTGRSQNCWLELALRKPADIF